MDHGSPCIKDIADFLLFLFEEKGLEPSTIDAYRSALADKLWSEPLQISKNEDLTRLLDSFHRDRPKGSRGVPAWNLSLVLHQLTVSFQASGRGRLETPDLQNCFPFGLSLG